MMSKKFDCILLVDDDSVTNELHQIIIRKADAAERVSAVTSGLDAIRYLTRTDQFKDDPTVCAPPQLILLDINMPAMNGFEFLAEYKKLEVRDQADIVVVMLTTSLNPDDEVRAQDFEQVRGFMHKPLTKEMLHKLYDEHIGDI